MGKITLYKGSKDGFESPVEIKQATDINDTKLFFGHLFTNPSLGDYNGDGLLDAFIGGAKGMRYMLNEGTKEMPSFGERKPLLDVNGNQIGPRVYTPEEIQEYAKNMASDNRNLTTPDFKTYVYFIDWDNDGIKDIVSTSGYYAKGVEAINFHKGVKTENGIRFEEVIPLFKAADDSKALPGSILIPYFADINGDGALDILLGVSLLCDENNNIVDGDFKTNRSNPDKNAKLKNKGFVMVFLSDKKYK